jgi:hypothetical protein
MLVNWLIGEFHFLKCVEILKFPLNCGDSNLPLEVATGGLTLVGADPTPSSALAVIGVAWHGGELVNW